MNLAIMPEGENLIVEYYPEAGTEWIHERLESPEIIIRGFCLKKEDILYFFDDSIVFVIGKLENNYYVIHGKTLGISHDIYLYHDLEINEEMFFTLRRKSIFKIFDKIHNADIIIGGDKDNAIPSEIFKSALETFPTYRELNLYVEARVESTLRDFLLLKTDAQQKYQNYLNNKLKPTYHNLIPDVAEGEVAKYRFIRERLVEMLIAGQNIREDDWQKEILNFILMLFPNYVAQLPKLSIKEEYSRPDKASKRQLDIALLDVNGNLDLIEIKQPFNDCVVSSGRYRDNFVPKHELSGAIVQAQKYLFYLSKLGKAGEDSLTKKYKDKLPSGMEIRITNPKAMIIMGRSNNLTQEQKFDFEIFKRKYADIIDIITYDDLLNRLDRIISHFERNCHE